MTTARHCLSYAHTTRTRPRKRSLGDTHAPNTGPGTTIKNILHTCFYHSADCDTDHSLVCCKIKLQPKRYHRGKKQGNPCIDVSKMSQPDLVEQFARRFESKLPRGSGLPCRIPCTTLRWSLLGERPLSHTTGMKPSPPR